MYFQDLLLILLFLGFTNTAFILHEKQGIGNSVIRTLEPSHAWKFLEKNLLFFQIILLQQ